MRAIYISLFILLSLPSSAQMLLVFGTSIERGAGSTHPDSSWVGRLKKAVHPQQLVSMAVSGSTYMDSIPTSMWHTLGYAQSQNYNPSYIILGGGFNDSKFNPQYRFQREYHRFLDTVKALWPNAELICNTPLKCKNYPVFASMLDTVIVPVTIEEGYAAGARICNLYQLPTTVLSADGVHPNNAGYGVIFRAWYNWFYGLSKKNKQVVIDPLDPAFDYAGRSFIWRIVFE